MVYDNLREKVDYLQGLTKSLNMSQPSPESKLLFNIVNVLDTFAEEVDNVNSSQTELLEYIESVDNDLTYLEEEIYADEYETSDNPPVFIDDEYLEITCPHCHGSVALETDFLLEDDEDDFNDHHHNYHSHKHIGRIDHINSHHKHHMHKHHPGI
ncbi:AraC family transcriptional regulator [Selenomonadales bacterium OttesenSCG-928-I06]|nr:AraC family transcriptional regulator [Selenomonadales bacterium OttesenSCG-928-I06]